MAPICMALRTTGFAALALAGTGFTALFLAAARLDDAGRAGAC
jgi:hypothetical protein